MQSLNTNYRLDDFYTNQTYDELLLAYSIDQRTPDIYYSEEEQYTIKVNINNVPYTRFIVQARIPSLYGVSYSPEPSSLYNNIVYLISMQDNRIVEIEKLSYSRKYESLSYKDLIITEPSCIDVLESTWQYPVQISNLHFLIYRDKALGGISFLAGRNYLFPNEKIEFFIYIIYSDNVDDFVKNVKRYAKIFDYVDVPRYLDNNRKIVYQNCYILENMIDFHSSKIYFHMPLGRKVLTNEPVNYLPSFDDNFVLYNTILWRIDNIVADFLIQNDSSVVYYNTNLQYTDTGTDKEYYRVINRATEFGNRNNQYKIINAFKYYSSSNFYDAYLKSYIFEFGLGYLIKYILKFKVLPIFLNMLETITIRECNEDGTEKQYYIVPTSLYFYPLFRDFDEQEIRNGLAKDAYLPKMRVNVEMPKMIDEANEHYQYFVVKDVDDTNTEKEMV